MATAERVLVCWHSERHGLPVLDQALECLRARRLRIDRVLYLVQAGRQAAPKAAANGTPIEPVRLDLPDPTAHTAVYEAVRDEVVPRLAGLAEVHVNVSPGTPAMHAVWIVLHAGGALPPGTHLWSSQLNPETKRTRIDPVEFRVNTYLREVHRIARSRPQDAVYEPDAKSPARKSALERLARYARVPGAPLLILGEPGTGKSRLVEVHVAALKGRKVVPVPCGGLDSTLADSLLFGHVKGAFTGATADRPGVLVEADGGVLFLDEVQDLPTSAQRRLVRVFQGGEQRFRPVGADKEVQVDVELVCASNLPLAALRERLDADLFDRLSHLAVEVPPLRECREDLQYDWGRVWGELRRDKALPADAPWSDVLARALAEHPLPGNLRALQRLAVLVMAWWEGAAAEEAIRRGLEEWRAWVAPPVAEDAEFGSGSRKQRVRSFEARLAGWAKARYGTWVAAAKALGCDEKTLWQDANGRRDGRDGTR